MNCTHECQQGRNCVCSRAIKPVKHCDTMHQPCPNKPECADECDSLKQYSDQHRQVVEMAASWRDIFYWHDIAGAIGLVVLAGLVSWYFF